jgi:SMODS domain-containing protein
MASALTRSVIPDLDYLLKQIIEDLQLTPTQYKEAVEHYEAVGRYLEHQGSPLAHLQPVIFPQGSMALQTTVKPIGRQEHDLDLVSQTLPSGRDPMWLYETTYAWLAANPQYAPILERYKRCIRLSYAQKFHLDVVPAEPDQRRPVPCILVPDCNILDWTPSNPLGYIGWFQSRAILRIVEGRVRAMAPVPAQQTAEDKAALVIAVQVIKRRRDWAFREDIDHAPRSVLLTTLAGLHYGGQESVIEAIAAILAATEAAIDAAAPDRIVVVNPTNPDESFTEAFNEISYRKFTNFVRVFRREIADLLSVVGGFPALTGQLTAMFGSEPAEKAVLAWGKRLHEARSGALRFSAAGGLAVGSDISKATQGVPRNNFYGE